MFALAYKNLTQNRAQFFMSVGGVALALLLMLSLDALLAGSEKDLVAYIETAGADIFLSQEGVKNMHMAASAITRDDLERAARAPGVASVSPILFTTSVIKAGDESVISYIIGFDPDEPRGGPQTVIEGRATIGAGEAIIDDAVAKNKGVNIGDDIEIFGETFKVVGKTKGLTNLINSVTFIYLDEFQSLRPGGDSISYGLLVLEPGRDPQDVTSTINDSTPGVLALTTSDFSREERQIIKDMSVEVLSIMNLSGLLIGLAVTALMLYTSTLRKKQEYGVLKAIGARNWHLYLVIGVQALMSLALGFVLAIGVVAALGWVLPLAMPGVGMALTQQGVTQVLVASAVIGTLAALAPAWQLSQLDPAEVFRG